MPDAAAAKSHATEENTGFGQQLRGDLDNIILMALEKTPARRYSSVEKLEDDIRRHLEGFPVAARSAGYLYQIGKFAGRHEGTAGRDRSRRGDLDRRHRNHHAPGGNRLGRAAARAASLR